MRLQQQLQELQSLPVQTLVVNITSGSSATNNAGIIWSSNGTGTIANPTSLTTATYTPGAGETGAVTLTLTATGNSPCANAVSTKTLNISSAPTAVAGTAVTTCSNSVVNITAGASATNNAGIIWSSDGTGTIANPSSLTTATYTPGAGETGTVTLTLTATGNAPCANAVSTKTLNISSAPTAVAGTAVTTCSNSVVNITAGASATNNAGIIWSSDGTGTIANPSSLTTATYTPGAGETGTVTLTLTATGNAPCANAVSTKTLNISSAPTAVAGTAVTTCSNSVVNITAGASATNNAGIIWSSDGTGTIANPSSLTTATYTPGAGETGTVTLTLTATGNAPCANAVSTKTLNISSAPTAVAGTGVTTCSNSVVNITAGASATNNAGIIWSSDGTGTIANPSSLTTATYTPGAGETGTVTLTLTATGNAPCANAVSTKTLNISSAPTAVAGTAVTTCSNSVVNITAGASATNNAGIIWSSDGTGTIANPSSLTTATYTPGAGETGTVTLTLTATGNAPCANAVSTKTLSINQEVSITTQPEPTQSICAGFPVSLTTNATGTGLTFEWFKNGVSTGITSQTLNINQVSAADAGMYTVEISGVAPCSSVTSDPAEIIVNQSIIINDQPEPNITSCEGESSVVISVAATGNIDSYLWRKDGIPISDAIKYSGFETSSLTISNIALSDAGNYDVVISSPGGSCSQIISNPSSLSVSELPEIDAIGPDFSVCFDGSTPINITSGALVDESNATIEWSVPTAAGTISNPNSLTNATFSPDPSYDDSNPVLITLKAFGINGCSATEVSATKELTFRRQPVISSFVYDETEYCISISTDQFPTITGDNQFSGGSYSYQYNDVGTGTLIFNTTTGAITPAGSTTGSYTITYTTKNDGVCGQDSATFDINITPLPTADFSYTASPFCSNSSDSSLPTMVFWSHERYL